MEYSCSIWSTLVSLCLLRLATTITQAFTSTVVLVRVGIAANSGGSNV